MATGRFRFARLASSVALVVGASLPDAVKRVMLIGVGVITSELAAREEYLATIATANTLVAGGG